MNGGKQCDLASLPRREETRHPKSKVNQTWDLGNIAKNQKHEISYTIPLLCRWEFTHIRPESQGSKHPFRLITEARERLHPGRPHKLNQLTVTMRECKFWPCSMNQSARQKGTTICYWIALNNSVKVPRSILRQTELPFAVNDIVCGCYFPDARAQNRTIQARLTSSHDPCFLTNLVKPLQTVEVITSKSMQTHDDMVARSLSPRR